MSSNSSSNNDQAGFYSGSTLKSHFLTNGEYLPKPFSIKPVCSLAPVFLVDSFLTSEVMNIWGDLIASFKQKAALNEIPCPPFHRLQSGGVISAHDMAVSIFYQIKGGREDFGEFHSSKHQHERFGFTHKGFLPEWSDDLPIHLLGNVIMELQKLLDEQFFRNEHGETYLTNGGWILSAALVSSPLRGTTVAYYLGKIVGERGSIQFLSLGRFFLNVAFIWEWLLSRNSQKGWHGIHFRLTHFNLSKDRSIFKFLKRIFAFELFDKGLDNATKDLVIEKYLVAPFQTHQNTFYRTYATSINRTTLGTENTNSHWLPGLSYLSKLMDQFDIRKEGKGLLNFMLPNESTWRENDGLVPLISQFHPKDCHQENCHHFDLPTSDKPYKNQFPCNLYPGTWYTSSVPNSSHLDLVPGFDNQIELPSVKKWVSNMWSRLLTILSSTFPSQTTIKDTSFKINIRSENRRIFMDDYFTFLKKVNHIYYSSKTIDSGPSKPYNEI